MQNFLLIFKESLSAKNAKLFLQYQVDLQKKVYIPKPEKRYLCLHSFNCSKALPAANCSLPNYQKVHKICPSL